MCAEITAKTILVVDDEPILRLTLSKLLQNTGFRVLAAADGEEGVRAGTECDVDVLITDLIMPRMGGWETLRALRSSSPDLPAIIMTASPKEHNADFPEDSTERFTRYVQKPIPFDELLELINDAIHSSEAHA